jgi:hypothetical protein
MYFYPRLISVVTKCTYDLRKPTISFAVGKLNANWDGVTRALSAFTVQFIQFGKWSEESRSPSAPAGTGVQRALSAGTGPALPPPQRRPLSPPPVRPPPHCLTRSSGAQTSAAGPREDALPSTPAPERGAGSSGGCRAPEGRSPAGGKGDRGRAQGSRWGTGQGRSSRGTRRGSPYAPSHPASALPRGQACLAARCPAPGRAPAEVRGTLRDKVRAGRGAQTVPVGRCRPPRST